MRNLIRKGRDLHDDEVSVLKDFLVKILGMNRPESNRYANSRFLKKNRLKSWTWFFKKKQSNFHGSVATKLVKSLMGGKKVVYITHVAKNEKVPKGFFTDMMNRIKKYYPTRKIYELKVDPLKTRLVKMYKNYGFEKIGHTDTMHIMQYSLHTKTTLSKAVEKFKKKNMIKKRNLPIIITSIIEHLKSGLTRSDKLNILQFLKNVTHANPELNNRLVNVYNRVNKQKEDNTAENFPNTLLQNYFDRYHTKKNTILSAPKPSNISGMTINHFRVGTRYTKEEMEHFMKLVLDKWEKYRQSWMKGDPLALVNGNLLITFFVMVNQYSYVNRKLKPRESTILHTHIYASPRNDMSAINRGLPVNKGANYYEPLYNTDTHPQSHFTPRLTLNRFNSVDIFRSNMYKLSFEQLRVSITRFINRLTLKISDYMPNGPLNSKKSKEIMSGINNFFEKEHPVNFYHGNNGMYQWAAMFGRRKDLAFIHPGNCTVIAILKLTFFEKLTHSKRRPDIFFRPARKVSLARAFPRSTEICHYGLRVRNATPSENFRGGVYNALRNTRYNYLKSLKVGLGTPDVQYLHMYNQLTTNSIFRGIQRMVRNTHYPGVVDHTRYYTIRKMSDGIEGRIDNTSKVLFRHIMPIITDTGSLNLNGSGIFRAFPRKK